MLKGTVRTGTDTVDIAGNDLAKKLNDWFTQFGPTAIFRTCATCKFMEPDAPAFCKRYDMTPPASVIVSACDQYEDSEEIPF